MYYVRITNLFFSQKMAAKEPEKKIPSTAAKAITRSPKLAVLELIHFSAHSAFSFTHGTEENGKALYYLLYILMKDILHAGYEVLCLLSHFITYGDRVWKKRKGRDTYLFQQH